MIRTIRMLAWAAVAIIAAAAGALGLWQLQRAVHGDVALPGVAAVGAPFRLTDHTGRPFGTSELAGRPYAIVFGFTQCPDVCPTTLLELSNQMASLGTDADRLRVVFVSVDPERDTPAHLAAYLTAFDPRIIGLSGSVDEIATVARAWRVFYEKVPTSSGYTINHTATVFLMNAQGRLASTLSFDEDPASKLAKLRRLASSGGGAGG